MPAVNNRTLVEDMIEAEIGKQSFGETYGFTLWTSAQGTPAGNVVIWSIAFTLKNALVGKPPYGWISVIPGDLPTVEQVAAEVSAATQGMLAVRQQSLSKKNGSTPTPGGKLIVPGRG